MLRPANTARLNGSTAEPRTKPGTDQRASLVGEVGARPQPIGGTNSQEPSINIDQIATRFTDHPDPAPGDVPIGHPYRQRWWLPIIGPTATCILNHLGDLDDNSNWSVTPALELAVTLGLGKGTGNQSPLIRSLDRLTRFVFGHFDIAPGESNSDPCLTLYRTVGLVPQRLIHNWPPTLQQAHAIDLAKLYRQAS